MAVFRIEKTRDYTVMSNHHLRNAELSLKSKGLLSMMLSLPEDWNYTTRGLAKICKEGTDSIGSALKELERAGYIVRNRLRDSKGKIVDVEYVIYETPHSPDTRQPCEDEPDTACPDTENPDMDNPCLENRPQLNKEKRNPEKQNTDSPSTEESNPIQSSPQSPAGANRTGRDWMRERESYRELILENIEYDYLCRDDRLDRDMLNELVELMVDTVCSRRETIRIAGDDYPAEVVKSRFMKLDSSHVQYVMDCMKDNTTYVRNIKRYLLAALYNAPTTINYIFTPLMPNTSTRIILKKPKTDSSIRKVWLPKTLAYILREWKKSQDELKGFLGDEYQDFDLVVALPNGRPCEDRIILKEFAKLREDAGLPKVVFHSLRHSSTTYKLKLNHGDLKATQGDTGHAEIDMITSIYAHILDEDRKVNAQKFETAFYAKPDLRNVRPPEEPAKSEPATLDLESLVEQLQKSPELASALAALIAAQAPAK